MNCILYWLARVWERLFYQEEEGRRDLTGGQTCALPIGGMGVLLGEAAKQKKTYEKP